MFREKDKWGVVVVLENERLVLITGEIGRDEAARFIRSARPVFPAIKFFPVQADKAAATIHRINQSGVVRRLLVDGEPLLFDDMALESSWSAPLPIPVVPNRLRF